MRALAAVAAAVLLATAPAATAAGDPPAARTFTPSATELPGDVARLPLHRGTSGGRPVHYVVLEASEGDAARRHGVATAAKLTNARGSGAVQRARVVDGVVDFPATVDFGPERRVTPGPGGFPPALAEPGAVGEAGYSPLVELPDGTILNAPHVANPTGRADKVVGLDAGAGTVAVRETQGFARDRAVRYISFDASDAAVAALEDVTFAPALADAPGEGRDGTDSSRTSLAAIVNGPTGAANPQRQGLASALLDGLDPLNLLRWLPNQGRYSPLWDVHPAAWTSEPRRVRAWDEVESLAAAGEMTGPGGAPFGPAGIVVNCPIISLVG
jgi:hypothetical protein